MNRRLTSTAMGLLLVLAAAVGVGCADPGESEEQPLFRTTDDNASTDDDQKADEKDEGNGASNIERGTLQVNEIHYAGSVSDSGVWDADDIFIELQNKGPVPLNLTGVEMAVRGDYSNSYIIPESSIVEPNDYFVIAKKADGAFGEDADVIISDLELGRQQVYINLRDVDYRLIGSGGSEEHRVFAGGYDSVTARSMERVQLLFNNSGTSSASWHAYSEGVCVEREDADCSSGATVEGDEPSCSCFESRENIAEGYREKTLASPGIANSTDYSGATSSGNFQ